MEVQYLDLYCYSSYWPSWSTKSTWYFLQPAICNVYVKKKEYLLGIPEEATETYWEENKVPATSDIKNMEDLDKVVASKGIEAIL